MGKQKGVELALFSPVSFDQRLQGSWSPRSSTWKHTQFFSHHLLAKVLTKQRSKHFAGWGPGFFNYGRDHSELRLGFRAVLEWAKDFKMMPQRLSANLSRWMVTVETGETILGTLRPGVPKRQLERIFVSLSDMGLPLVLVHYEQVMSTAFRWVAMLATCLRMRRLLPRSRAHHTKTSIRNVDSLMFLSFIFPSFPRRHIYHSCAQNASSEMEHIHSGNPT